MSAGYVAVQWNRRKLVYDAILLVGVAAYTQLFALVTRAVRHGAESITSEQLQMRAWGSCAFLMLTLILCIGPLARLDRRFLPVLYNRRHFGVLTALVAGYHAYHVLGYYYAYGRYSPSEALLTYDAAFTGSSVPFVSFGVAALLFLVVMAVTSHDYWQKFLGPQRWKWLHMGVYLAYTLVIAHVAFGELQWEDHLGFAAWIVLSAAAVVGLHLVAAVRSNRDAPARAVDSRGDAGWLDAGAVEEFEVGRPRPLAVPDAERVAVIRNADETFSAIHGVCAHQGGPLYEGRVIDDCVTCPWHGWQYRAQDGQSPPPFTELVPTYRVRVEEGRVLVDTRALPPGTPVDPAPIGGAP